MRFLSGVLWSFGCFVFALMTETSFGKALNAAHTPPALMPFVMERQEYIVFSWVSVAILAGLAVLCAYMAFRSFKPRPPRRINR